MSTTSFKGVCIEKQASNHYLILGQVISRILNLSLISTFFKIFLNRPRKMNNTSLDYALPFWLFKDVHWMFVYICEAFLILTGNSLTIYTFFRNRKRLKRTSYLLINLAVADAFVGMVLTLFISADVAIMLEKDVSLTFGETVVALDISATVASLSSLVLISLERMVAILWPLRHRLIKTRYFYVSVGFVWFLSAANVLSNLRLYNDITYDDSYSVFTSVTFVTSLVVITVSYLAIWISVRLNAIPSNDRRSMGQSRKLAKTLFIVTALSIMTSLPYGIIITLKEFSEDFFSFKVQIIMAVQYANSLLNPVIYCFRMPEFKASLKKLFCCHCSGGNSFHTNSTPFNKNHDSISLKNHSLSPTSGITLRSVEFTEANNRN